jgi:hypothetical protein
VQGRQASQILTSNPAQDAVLREWGGPAGVGRTDRLPDARKKRRQIAR